MKTKNKTTIIALISLVFALSFVIAAGGIGVSSPYWKENPLKMYPGESRTIYLNLVITEGSEETFFTVDMTEDGQGIAILTEPDKTYSVKSGAATPVPITLTIPEDMRYGETRTVRISFTEVSDGSGSGMITFQSAVEGKFPIEIVRPEEGSDYIAPPTTTSEGNTIWYWIIGILIVLIIIYLIARKK